MALINCPECSKEISNKASTCIHCGCPLDDISSDFYLKKIILHSYSKGRSGTSAFITHLTGMGIDDSINFMIAVNNSPQVVVDGVNNITANKIIDIFSSLGANAEILNSDTKDEKKINVSYQIPDEPNIPKCPTCGSKDILKLNTLDRVASVALLGLASGSIGKTFYCKSCKFKW